LFGPLVAAFIVTAVVFGRRGAGDLWRRMIRWRVAPRWWLVAFSPVGFLGIALLGEWIAGAPSEPGSVAISHCSACPGRRTGQLYEFPVQYARDDDPVWVMPGNPANKTWWRNLGAPGRDIELRLAGDDYRGHAIALEGANAPQEVAAGSTTYLVSFPRAARALGIDPSVSAEQRTQLDRVIRAAVMV